MLKQSSDDSLLTPAADSGPLPTAGRCQPPADFRNEVRQYDERATVGTWSGPRYRMIHRTLGQGPTLIWLPGIAATYRTYALVLNRLAEGFRTIQYEYPGDREGDGARLGRITHDHLVDDLFGLMDHLGIGRAHLAGISFGATIALVALARAPERFSRAVVQGAFAHRRFTAAERLALFLGRRVPGTAARLPLRQTILAYNSKLDFPRIIEDRWPFYLEENGKTPIRALAHRTSLVARLDLRASLARISAELLLVQGRDDRIVPHRYFEELKAALPRAESVVMPTAGHIPHITHAESLARLIGDWLRAGKLHARSSGRDRPVRGRRARRCALPGARLGQRHWHAARLALKWPNRLVRCYRFCCARAMGEWQQARTENGSIRAGVDQEIVF